MPITPITVDDGKYTFQTAANGYGVEILRHREPWVIIDAGCNAVHSLMYEVERLRAIVEESKADPPDIEIAPLPAPVDGAKSDRCGVCARVTPNQNHEPVGDGLPAEPTCNPCLAEVGADPIAPTPARYVASTVDAVPEVPSDDAYRARMLIDGLIALAKAAGLPFATWSVDDAALYRAASKLPFTNRHTAGHGPDAFDVLNFGGVVAFYGQRVCEGGEIVDPEPPCIIDTAPPTGEPVEVVS